MAIYRPRRSRWPAILVALLVGLGLGAAITAGLLAGRPADVSDAASRVRTTLNAAASLLEVARIEYAEAVIDGAVVKQTEFQGAVDAVARSKARWQEVQQAVATLDPPRAAAIAQAYADVEGLMGRHVPLEELGARMDSLIALLRGTPSPSPAT